MQREAQDSQPNLGHRRSPLTNREAHVAFLIGQGKATKEIATALRLSPATVSSHCRSICRKLKAHSTAELVHRLLTGDYMSTTL
jgi:DNA-binding CsgD family transcriptional regulator